MFFSKMAQDAPAAQMENKTNARGVSQHHLCGLPFQLLDTILLEIDAIGDLSHFVATARFVYRRFRT